MDQPALIRSISDIMTGAFPTAPQVGFDVTLLGPNGVEVTTTHPGDIPVAAATAGTRYNLMCGFKPVAMMSAIAAIERARPFCVDDTPGWEAGGTASWKDALGHRAGLGDPDALTFISQSEPARSATARRVLAQPVVRTPTAFSEVAILLHLDRLTTAYAGWPLPECVGELVSALGLSATFCFSNRAPVREIGCLLDTDVESGPLPYLHDRLPHFHGHRTTTFFGGYSTVADMATFYRSLMDRAVHGRGPDGLPSRSILSDLLFRSSSDAPVMPYEGGCMRLSAHGIGEAGDQTFGHIGFLRTTLGFFDPETDIAGFAIVRDAGHDGLGARLEGWNTFVREIQLMGLADVTRAGSETRN